MDSLNLVPLPEIGQPENSRVDGSGMLDLECRLYRVRPEFPNYVDVFDTPGHVQRVVEFVKDEIAELMAFKLLCLVTPRHPDVTSGQLAKANRSPLHLVMLCRNALDVFVNMRVQQILPHRDMDQFLSPFERLQDAKDVAVVLRKVRYRLLVDH